MELFTDVVIVGTGISGLFCALNFPITKKIIIITKSDCESSDSFLAQGGICVMRGEKDYKSYFEDTLRAGHYENRKESVDIMLKNSEEIIEDLVNLGVEFEKDKNGYIYTKEGAHSNNRILYHKDITGKEITSKLLSAVKKLSNVQIMEYTEMTDIIVENGACKGIIAKKDNESFKIFSKNTVLATGGIGGRYKHSTNFPHLTGDSLVVAQKYGIKTQDLGYVQIHPTTLYSKKRGRRFLISESVRGEGAILLDKNGKRFTDELKPRDVVTAAIRKQMDKDRTDFVLLSLEKIPKEEILTHFPNIYKKCLEEGYDILKEPIPVVPAQHYFMGGIWVDKNSHTSMKNLYAVGETSCNGVHGANRLASNSLLESLVFSKLAAKNIEKEEEK